MTVIDHTAFARLEQEGRLFSPVLKGPTHKLGRFGFRGELAVTFAQQIADEKRPPELAVDQVIATATAGGHSLEFFAAYLLSFGYLKPLAEVLSGLLSPEGKYFVFCNNIDPLKKYQVTINGVRFYVLPIDEATVYNELLDLLYLEKTELKKLDTAGKTDAIVEAALKFSETYPELSYEDGVKLMGPVRNPNENRPV